MKLLFLRIRSWHSRNGCPEIEVVPSTVRIPLIPSRSSTYLLLDFEQVAAFENNETSIEAPLKVSAELVRYSFFYSHSSVTDLSSDRTNVHGGWTATKSDRVVQRISKISSQPISYSLRLGLCLRDLRRYQDGCQVLPRLLELVFGSHTRYAPSNHPAHRDFRLHVF